MEAKKSILLLCFALLRISIMAQNKECSYTLSGKISDEHDASPLAFSYINILEINKIVSADIDGKYHVDNLCQGKYTLVISHIGCVSDTVTINIGSHNQEQNFQLEHHAEQLATVWIHEDRKQLHSIDQQAIDRQRGGLIAKMMENISGVQSMNTGSNFSIPVVHGMTGNRLSIINNGIPLMYQQWGSEHSPEIDPFTINSLSLLSGTEALRYSSGNIGGALVASPPDFPTDTAIHGDIYAILGSNKRMGNLSAILKGRMKNLPSLTWSIQTSGKKGGNTKTPNYYLNNTGVEELNYSASLHYQFQKSKAEIGHSDFSSKIGIFPGSHISDYAELEHLIEEDRPDQEYTSGFSYEIQEPYQKIEHQKTYLKYSSDFGKSSKLSVLMSRQNNQRTEYENHEDHMHSGHENPNEHEELEKEEEPTSYHLNSYTASANLKIISEKNHWSEFGIQSIFVDNEVGGEDKFIPGYESRNYSFYALRKWYLNNVVLDAGFRLDHGDLSVFALDRAFTENKEQIFNSLSFSSGIKFDFSEEQNIKLNFSFAQRAPGINELYSEGVHHGTASVEMGNSKLQNESNFEINMDYALRKERLLLKIFLYNKYISDFIHLSPQGIDSNDHGIYPMYNWKQSDANFVGADFFLRYWLLKQMNVDLEANYLHAKNLENSSALSFIPPNSIESSINYSFQNSKKIQEKYISFRLKYVAKQDDVPKEIITDSPSSYFLFGLETGMLIKLGENKLRIGLEVNNLFNEEYRDYMNRLRYFSDAMGRNIVLRLKYGF